MPDITCLADLRAVRERREAETAFATPQAGKPTGKLKVDGPDAFPAPCNMDNEGFTYPWDDMKVGHSFFIPDRTMQAASKRVQKRQKMSGHRYTCRTMDGGVRVWRTA
jgi:hypothetical protein